MHVPTEQVEVCIHRTNRGHGSDLYLLDDDGVIEGHLQDVAQSVVGMDDLRDGAGAGIRKWNRELPPVQTNGSQPHVRGDVAQVDREGELLLNRPWNTN